MMIYPTNGQANTSVILVASHFIVGGWVWILVTSLVVIFPDSFTQHYFNPQLLSMTHLLVLGWLTMAIFGALYQLLPVVMEVRLHSEKIAFSSMACLLTGACWLAVCFWNFWLGTPIFFASSIILISILLFAFNVYKTSRKSNLETIENKFVQTAVVWLVFTAIAGLLLALNLTMVFLPTPHIELLKLHANVGIGGWFMQLIIGVSSRLVPMFVVSHSLDKNKLKTSYFFINTGLVFSIVSIYLQWHYIIIVSVMFIILGSGFFISFVSDCFKKRFKKQLDMGMKQTGFSFLMLFLALFILFFLMATTHLLDAITLPLSIALASTLLIGFISSLIMGQTYKTLPFIIWLHRYKGRIGKTATPFPKDLYSEPVANIQMWSFTIGFLVLLMGILTSQTHLVSVGGGSLFFSSTLYMFNVLKIVFHKTKNTIL